MKERKTNSTNFLNQSFLEEKCPLNELLFFLSKRWTTEILFCIEEGNNRFSGIKEELVHISDHILSDRLKLLEKEGFISKRYFNIVPPRVEYSLTGRGKELSNLLDKLCKFAEGKEEEVENKLSATVPPSR